MTPLDTSHPLFAERTGAGVLVALIDSGVHAGHPHVNGVRGGIAVTAGRLHDDFEDRLGHGTAVAAVIREKAPGAELYVIRIFEDSLSAPGPSLVTAFRHALDVGARLVNLSLGTARADLRETLADLLEQAASRGALIVSAVRDGASEVLPGSLAGAVGVEVAWDCPRHEIRVLTPTPFRLAASGFPRPIPGVSPERNLRGTSFAVANAAGMLARLVQDRPELVTPQALAETLGGSGIP